MLLRRRFPNASPIILLLFSVFLVSCSGAFDIEAEQALVAKFHEHLNAENHNAIYEMGSQGFKASGSKEEFVEYFSAVRKKLGKYESTALVNWSVNYDISGNFTDLEYESVFEEGKAQEAFRITTNDKIAKLHIYKINSNVFILK